MIIKIKNPNGIYEKHRVKGFKRWIKAIKTAIKRKSLIIPINQTTKK